MRGIRVNTNGPATKGLAELNHHIRDEKKEVRDGIAGEGHGLSEEDESKINEDGEDANRACKELVRPLAVQQRPQQQPQGPVVCWERFLPLRSLKVLLVENDDSTRHVVSALLRNCSYEVSSVANGLEAWKILEDSTTNIDLVLTEVAVPCLSGIGLLGKIMSHKNCMNIPVIMMSSNDSIGIVFKCLSKGAVDFLVKPIRKNELKNLWQHVWRKCHSSSGSGSESGIRTQKYSKIKSVEASDNNTDSYDEDDNTSIGLNVRDGSDNGSGTQSSWTKRAVEVDSPQPMSPWDQLADPPDSTCAQDIHSRPEAFSNNWVPITVTRKCHGQDDELDNVAIGKDLEIGVPRNPDLQVQDQSKKVSTALVGANKEKLSKLESKKDGEKLEQGKLDINSGTRNGELTKEVDLTVTITNCTNPQMESVAIEVPTEISKTNIKDKAIYDTKEMPSLELSLKSVRDVGEIGTSAQERNVLRHSDLSAFSRYNTATANQAPTGNIGSCSPVDNISEAAKTESIQNLQSNSNGTPNQLSNGSSNNNDMGSTTNNAFTKPAAFTDKPMLKSAVNIHPCSAFQPVQNSHGSSLQSVTPGKADDAAVNTVLVPARGAQPQVQVQHHHHHYHHHHHHVHNMQQKQQQNPKHDDLSVRTMVAATPNCGPSNVLSTPIEGNAANYSLTGSASGSNKGSNGHNGSSAAVVNEGTNMASDDGVAEKSGAGGDGGSGSGSRSGVDQNRFTQREAALNKFRLKRKDRCFEKKVRYQSRKRLAEQRPRVRGQFVRQVMYENESKDKDS
ncbi:two-component response regulator-like PRR37 [Actinidia eriantha]|uniref:two-component response regulator-like PRR37 n=1 Tax=Actinidia eriantha TaxID=165200 RepID=UPI00258CC83A|nr:two-component response regulator-like PRR37 [Actinidia eriantha]XP_057511689.1 two-component response regulator-like PRR37 [Actinidia eriantha]